MEITINYSVKDLASILNLLGDVNYYKKVIRTLKKLGFNAVRFHTWVPVKEYLEEIRAHKRINEQQS